MKVTHNLTKVERRVRRIRKKVRGTEARPRLTIFRSNKHVYLQVINDETGKTLASSSDRAKELQKTVKGKKTGEIITAVTEDIIKRLQQSKISTLVFDRGRHRYHGYIKMIADKLRESGVQI